MFAKLVEQATTWVRRDRADGWLRGAALEDAETWLANSTGKTPPPTDLQREFILASRQERQQELERWENLYKIAEQRRIAAEKNEVIAFCKSSDAFLPSIAPSMRWWKPCKQVDGCNKLTGVRRRLPSCILR